MKYYEIVLGKPIHPDPKDYDVSNLTYPPASDSKAPGSADDAPGLYTNAKSKYDAAKGKYETFYKKYWDTKYNSP